MSSPPELEIQRLTQPLRLVEEQAEPGNLKIIRNSSIPFSPAVVEALEQCDVETIRKRLGEVVKQRHPDTGWAVMHTVCHSTSSPKLKIKIIKLLLENGADVNEAIGNELWTPLHAATVGGDVEVVRFLLENGARTDAEDGRCQTPITIAIDMGYVAVVDLLLAQCGFNFMIHNGGYKTTLLHHAATTNHVAVIELLLARGGLKALEAKNDSGQTPLLYCLSLNAAEFFDSDDDFKAREKVVEALICAGANLTARDNSGRSILHEAARYGFRALVLRCLDNGLDINDNGGGLPQPVGWYRDGFHCTPLHLAVWGAHLELVQLLISFGANPSLADHEGKHPLHYLLEGWDGIKNSHGQDPSRAFSNAVSIAGILLYNGAIIDAKDNKQYTPFHRAVEVDPTCLPVLEFLLVRGAAVNTRSDSLTKGTPLHAACSEPVCLHFLLQHGADVHMRDVQGASALHMASQEGWKESVSLLLESGADVDSQDVEGRVPLHYASRHLRKDCLDLLKSYGANETLRDLRGSLPRDYLAVEEKKFESKKAQDALRRERGGLGRGRS
ncbi:hypothetical protein V495_01247 [Pseudogymnoascus sp. VKM F-4514 (FW-929)]|nr:hypothetical protein V495_01247 [Pseudogymnoascus sp. VKM F-4514 (FW-929)]KFY54929.1 hypothetical protein V497_07339 [Pseudogymnoascus sp. VKM F-4516 (FW-969)]